jgi:signal peptidase I
VPPATDATVTGPRPARAGSGVPERVLLALLLGVLLLGLARPLVLDTFGIASASMAPTLRPGDRVAVATFHDGLGDLRRGDVVAFEDTERPGEVAIKRLVALPGDTVALRAGALLVNGRRQGEPYVDAALAGQDFFGPVAVPAGHVFVLGDNRVGSVDSRFTGAVPAGALLGRILVRWWPLSRVALL